MSGTAEVIPIASGAAMVNFAAISSDLGIDKEAKASVERWPDKFQMRTTGLHWGAGDHNYQRICGRFTIIGEASAPHGNGTALILEWSDRHGGKNLFLLPAKSIHSPGLPGLLAEAGLACVAGEDEVKALRKFLSLIRPKNVLRTVRSSGWHESGEGLVFMMPDGRGIGVGGDKLVIRIGNTLGATKKAVEAHASKGTLDEWKINVAALPIGNSRLVLAMCTALTGPLMYLTGWGPGGIHLVGESSTGKSSTLVAAGSVWGPSTDPGGSKPDYQVQSWRATDNALEAMAASASDAFMGLDEMGVVEARVLSSMIYMLMNGTGKERLNDKAERREAYTWRPSIFSTGECTVAQKLAEIGKKPPAGLGVRLIEVPADAEAGMGCFQNLHGSADARAFSERMMKNAARFHGTAAPEFLRKIASCLTDKEKPAEVSDLLNRWRDEFVAKYVPDGADGQVFRVAKHFGALAAAGWLATKVKIMPWDEDEAERGCAECLKAWMKARGHLGSGESLKIMSQPRDFIMTQEHRFAKLAQDAAGSPSAASPAEKQAETERLKAAAAARVEASLKDVEDPERQFREVSRYLNQGRAGYLVDLEVRGSDGKATTERFYLILPPVWRDEVCEGIDPQKTAALLQQKGYLMRGEGTHLARYHTIEKHRTRYYTVSSRLLEFDADIA